MRMWMVDPRILCRQHLLGEHVELHMFVGTINRGCDVKGYVENNLFESSSLYTRHDNLVEEMKQRFYNHRSPLKPLTRELRDSEKGIVDKKKSLEELLFRCALCKSRYKELQNE